MSSAAQPRRSPIANVSAREIFDLVRDDLVLVEREIAAQSGSTIEPEIGRAHV